MSLNQCSFIGNLGADPEIKSFQNGGKVCNLRLAVTEKWKDKNTGERQERTEWVSVAIFSEGLVGVCERYLRKGSKIFVQGQMQTRKWQDSSGADRYSTEIVLRGMGGTLTMLDGAPGKQSEDRTPARKADDGWTGRAPADDLDDSEVPF